MNEMIADREAEFALGGPARFCKEMPPNSIERKHHVESDICVCMLSGQEHPDFGTQ